MMTTKPNQRPKPQVTIRPATRDDLPALTDVVLRSFPTDPQWYYRLPYAKEFPEDHFKYSMERLGAMMDNVTSGRAVYMAAEVEKHGKKKVVGEAMWQLPGTHLPGSKNGE